MRENKLKQLWEEGKTAINAWLTIPNAWTAETMAHIGFDAITIDMQLYWFSVKWTFASCE